ncbi:MAG: transglycosylase SLT domain-containing protein [Saprospiraceae bacterium]|nr:transglycosylase SLT domain-containing protein [Saprospiraceae bacterium]
MRTYILILTLFLVINNLAGQVVIPVDTTKQEEYVLADDDPIAAMLDSLLESKFYKFNISQDKKSKHKYEYSVDSVPEFTDSIYKLRIEYLNENSPFKFVYNEDVQHYIDLYASRRRKLAERVLGLSQLYFPLFEEQLDKFNIPLEIKYLAIIESALNPTAVSRSRAVGLWQFMLGTGKIYGLEFNSFVDERSDPYKSTVAACKHLSYLYDIYGDWSVVLAAYNAGSGNVNRAIKRSGDATNYWEIRQYLPKETRNYVPGFIAMSYVMNYYKEHNIQPREQIIKYGEIDTVTITQNLSFEQISEFLKIPVDELHYLNPAYLKSIIPASEEKLYTLTLPKSYIADFVNNEKELYSYRTVEQQKFEEKLMNSLAWKLGANKGIHTVKRGESLNVIANKYQCSVSEIKTWNNLTKNMIHPGQELIVYIP